MNAVQDVLFYNVFGVMQWELQIYQTLGLTLSATRFILSLFASLFAGLLLFYLTGRQARLIYSLVTGFVLVYYPFGNEVFLAMPPLMLTYAFMFIAPSKCGQIAWIINFPYLLAWHMFAASGYAWQQGEVDFTGSQMVITLKVIALATSRADGATVNKKDLSQYAKDKCLTRVPSLLEYLSYAFAFGNLLVGPFIEYKDFEEFIGRKGVWEQGKDKKRLEFPVKEVLYYISSALTLMVIYLVSVSGFNISAWDNIYDLSFPYRYAMVYVVCVTYRLKFYFVWTLAECSLIMSGLGFFGYQQNPDGKQVALWNRCNHANMFKVELCDSCAIVPQYWNIGTGIFLRRYVYERLRGKPFQNMLVTQLVSGLWHGLFPGQIMFFAFSAFLFQSAKVVYRFERAFLPLWFQRSDIWRMFKIVFTSYTLNSIACSFVAVEFERSLAVWGSLGYSAHIMCVALTLLGPLIPPQKKERTNGNHEKKVS